MKASFLAVAAALGALWSLPAGAQVLAHRYSFNGTPNDSVGTANGTVIGGVTLQTAPGVNGSAVFGGGSSGSAPSFISLPPSTVSGLQNATVEIFTTNFNEPPSSANFQALFAVGTAYGNQTNYSILSANRANAGIGTGARTNNAAETVVQAHDPLPVWVQNHVVDLVYSGFTGVGSTGTETLYLDGNQIAQGQTVCSFADVAAGPGGIATVGIGGGSPFNDPTFSGSMDEVRIFAGALSQAQITADVAAGPAQLGFTPPPLTLYNQSVTNYSTTAVTVGWTTSDPADSTVHYGTTSAYGSTATGAGGTTGHSVPLTGLSLNTLYHYQVVSVDSYGRSATSPDATFTTAAPALTLSAPVVSGVSGSGAAVAWTTSSPATGTVRYGLTASYGSTAAGAGGTADHSVGLTGLRAGTVYHYQVVSKDAYGQTVTSPDATFTTAAPPLEIVGPTASALATTAAVSWVSSNAASATVNYGTTTAYGSTATGVGGTSSHKVPLNGSTPGTLYHYQVVSADAFGQTVTSGDATFTTSAPPLSLTAPVVSGLSGAGATVAWTTSNPAGATVNYGLTSAYGSTATGAGGTTGHSIGLTGLQALTVYHYQVVSTDAFGQTVTSPDATFTTNAPALSLTAPVLSGLSGTGATVAWTTSNPATGTVRYGLTSAYGGTAGGPGSALGHQVTLADLKPLTLYHYQVVSADAFGQTVTSNDATFTTAAPPLALTGPSVSGLSGSGATVAWGTSNPASDTVNYGTTTAYGSTLSGAGGTVSHRLALSGLQMSTVYHYQVTSTDAYGQTVTSPDATFNTGAPALKLSGLSVAGLSGSGATVAWATSNPAGATVNYGTTTAYGSAAGGPAGTTSHSVPLTGLLPGTVYHYQVTSTDAFGQTVTSPDATFTMPAPPLTLSGLAVSALSRTGATLSWTTSSAAGTTIRYGLTSAYGSTASGAGDTVSHSVSVTGLKVGTVYHYQVVSTDAYGQTVTSPDATFTTGAPPLTLDNVYASGITTSSATVAWTTSNSATSTVRFGPTPSYGSTAGGAGGTANHQVNVSGLRLGAVYHYQVVSTDAFGQTVTGPDGVFTTASGATARLVAGPIVAQTSGSQVVVTLTLTDTGAADATSVQLTGAQLGSAASHDLLPLTVGTIPAGSALSVTLHFPAGPGQTMLSWKAVCGGGSFSGSGLVKTP